jgi:hypothetical protein
MTDKIKIDTSATAIALAVEGVTAYLTGRKEPRESGRCDRHIIDTHNRFQDVHVVGAHLLTSHVETLVAAVERLTEEMNKAVSDLELVQAQLDELPPAKLGLLSDRIAEIKSRGEAP